MKPAAVFMNETRADVLIYWIHVFASFIMLAYLPFSKFFHILSDPLIMIVNGISDKKQKSDPAASLPRRALELDACTQCGTCSKYCSVAPVYRVLGNEEILPSEKMSTAIQKGKGKNPTPGFMADIAEGAYICTECFRCTDVCPTGINLQDQWIAQKKSTAAEGFKIPQVQVKNQTASEWAMKLGGDGPGKDAIITEQFRRLSDKNASFEACIQCQTCTNVCPVVACNIDPANAVDITPQKIMNLLRMGLRDMALGSRMVWDCTTCYQCQENCPQGIHVTDIIYELKNMAYSAITELKYQAIDQSCSKSCCCGSDETKKK
jgi:heterodisulfide reductase subunit C